MAFCPFSSDFSRRTGGGKAPLICRFRLILLKIVLPSLYADISAATQLAIAIASTKPDMVVQGQEISWDYGDGCRKQRSKEGRESYPFGHQAVAMAGQPQLSGRARIV